MPKPFDPKKLSETLEVVEPQFSGVETFTFESGGITITIREPLWREYAIGINLLSKMPENPLIAYMSLVPMIIADYNGQGPAIDVQQLASMPKSVFLPLMDKINEFFLDVSGEMERSGQGAVEGGLSDQRGQLPEPLSIQRNDSQPIALTRGSPVRDRGRETTVSKGFAGR